MYGMRFEKIVYASRSYVWKALGYVSIEYNEAVFILLLLLLLLLKINGKMEEKEDIIKSIG